MSAGSQNISVSFKVSGSELSAYIDQIQKKSDQLAATAIKGALEQSQKSKDQLKLINEQIAALEKKSKIETQAARNISLSRRETDLTANKDYYEGKKESVFADPTLSEQQKKEKIIALEGGEKEKAERIKNDYRENLTVLKEQDRQSKIQTQLAKENIETLKQTAKENVKAVMQGDLKLSDVIEKAQTDEEKLVAKLTEEEVRNEKRLEAKEKVGGSKENVFSSLLGVDNINKVIGSAGQFTQTQNGFDLIQPASNLAGRIAGGIIGGLIGVLAGGVGAAAGAAVGASIGGGFGDVLGSLEQREALSKEKFKKSAFRYNAVTGTNLDTTSIPDLSQAGTDFTQFMDLRSEYARRRGSATDSDFTTREAIYAERGLGVDLHTSALLVELQRSAKENEKHLASLIGGVLEKGQGSIFKNGDNTFLNEFLGKFTTLQKELLKNSTIVHTGTTMDIIKQFNSMGGMFDARDPRSMGMINSINSSLTNPSSDNVKALAFGVLRDLNPKAGIFSLREEMQKGLNSPMYLKGMLGAVDRLGGDDETKLNNLSGMFPGVPLSAIRTLYQNRNNFKRFDSSELKAHGITDDVLKGKAEANTTYLEKNVATIENAILSGEAIEGLKTAFENAVRVSLSSAVIELKNGQGTIKLNGGPIKDNGTKAPFNDAKAKVENHDFYYAPDFYSPK